jgi:hypothetical protein
MTSLGPGAAVGAVRYGLAFFCLEPGECRQRRSIPSLDSNPGVSEGGGAVLTAESLSSETHPIPAAYAWTGPALGFFEIGLSGFRALIRL